ncbi:MAG: MHFG family PEP-CTERM protein [Burkholderiales bacterium]|nr:MHFG family PEP-CTERM protein [Burkholderiales bacterium]
MPFALAALAAASAIQPSCSWDRPGVNPYRGNVRDALERYTDIPDAERIALKHRIQEGQADEQVQITRDAIRGQHEYDPAIHDMHFGAASVCHDVTRSKWAADRIEPGAVYCVKDHCILVPKICGNISRVSRRPAAPAAEHQAAQLHAPLLDLDPGLADADRDTPDEEDVAKARQHSRDVLDQLSKIASLTEAATPDAAGDDDPEGRRRLAGHYFSPFDSDSEPFATAPDDSFVPTPVPEPDSWAMLLGGLSVLPWAARRQRKAKAAAQASAN